MADFTLFTKLNYISPSEMALVIMGYHHETQTSKLDDEAEQEYRALSRALSRNVNYIDSEAKQSTKKITDADIVLCAAYPFIIDGSTHPDVIARVDHAIAKLTRRRGWRELLEALGGDVLLQRGKELHIGGRGEHRRSDEDESNYKLIGLLLRMVADKGLAKYGEFSEPVISEIYRDLSELCNKYEINMKGLAESTFYKKAKKSKYYIDE